MDGPTAVVEPDRGLYRSLMFTPGNDERKLAKVTTLGADVVVLDLEDAVADAEKVAARATARAALDGYADATAFIRVNPFDSGLMEDDVAAVVGPGLAGIMLPKVEDPAALPRIDSVITAAERAAGLPDGSTQLLGLIETARGVVAVDDIAAAAPARTVTLCFGQGDFSADLGIALTPDATEVLYARSRLVVAVRAARLAPPIDGPYLDIRDLDGLRSDSQRSRQLGYQGRIAIHPLQVEVIQSVFGHLTEEQRHQARAIVAAFEEAETRGLASIQVEGTFVDYPIYERAKRMLAAAVD